MRLDQADWIMLGDREVSRVYLGANMVWEFSPAFLFAQGEAGGWFDPSDLSTLFQDAEGTVPVTAVEQPVGLLLDKSRGKPANGPRRVNRLTNTVFAGAVSGTDTESVQPAGWNKVFWTDGSIVVDESIDDHEITFSTTSGRMVIGHPLSVTEGQVYVFSADIEVLSGSYNYISVLDFTAAGTGAVRQYFLNGVPIDSGVTLSSGRLVCVLTIGSGTSTTTFRLGSGANAPRTGVVKISKPDARLVEDSNILPSYQRITASWSDTIPGNHAYQTTTTARPILSARYNLLTQTEQLDDVLAWGTNVTQLVDGQTDAPDGTNTAFRMSGKSGLSITPTRTVTVPTGALKFSIFLRHIGGGASNINTLVRSVTSSTNLVSANLGQGGSGASSYGSWTKTDVGNGWFRIDISVTSGVNPSDSVSVYLGRTNTPGVDQVWDVWHPDLRALSDANLPYQWVNTATDYDTVGFPHYLRFDGVDDHLTLGVLDMSASTAAGYFGAITKLSDASSGRWYSHSLTTSAGSVRLLAPANPGQPSVRVGFYSSEGLKEVGGTSHAAPITVTVRSEIAPGDTPGLWITHNNVAAPSAAVPPTGFSADGEACIGAQVHLNGGRANYFNGRLYSLIFVGKKSNISEHRLIESFLRKKSKAY